MSSAVVLTPSGFSENPLLRGRAIVSSLVPGSSRTRAASVADVTVDEAWAMDVECPGTVEPDPRIPVTMLTARGEAWPGSREQALWRDQLRLSTQLLIRLDTDLASAHGLSIADYAVLVVIAEGPPAGVRMSTIAEYVMISRSRLTHCVDRLEARRLVERTKAEDDRRGFLCTLREEGRELLTEAIPVHVRGVRQYFIDLITDDHEFEVIHRFIGRVLHALETPDGEFPPDGHITIDDVNGRDLAGGTTIAEAGTGFS